MNKRNIKFLVLVFIFVFVVGIKFNTKTISTEFKKVNANNKSDETDLLNVTDRELALLASLVYEPVPNEKLYTKSLNSNFEQLGCTIVGDKINKRCFFDYNIDNEAMIGAYKVKKYVEGMSSRKLNWFTTLTSTMREDGQQYYFYDFADTSEVSDWEIVNFESSKGSVGIPQDGIITGWSGTFDAITFKKGNNYVISFRGTDFPDFMEWLIDISYIVGKNEQSDKAFSYARNEYTNIINGQYDENANPKDIKIYVTGHSLGAYLAEIGAAGIVSLGTDESGAVTNPQAFYNLEKVIYFNGMGIDALSLQGSSVISNIYKKVTGSKLYTEVVGDNLEYLATHTKDGKQATRTNGSGYKVNWSNDIYSSGRLALYRIDGDPVSSIALHYGEVWEFEPAADAVSHHKGSHFNLLISTLAGAKKIVTETSDVVVKATNEVKEAIANWVDIYKESFNLTKQEATNKYSSTLSNTLSVFIDGMEKLEEISDTEVSVPSGGIHPDILSFNLQAVPNLLNSVLNAEEKYNFNNIIESMNTAHETDSFACLQDDPKITAVFSVDGLSEEFDSFSYSTGDEKYTDVGTYYTNGKTDLSLIATVENGCASKYTWYELNSRGEYIELSSKDNNYVVAKNSKIANNTTKTYKVVVDYGSKYQEKKLNVDGTKYGFKNGELIDKGSKQVSFTFKIIYDKVAPTCYFSPTKLALKETCTEVTKTKTFLWFKYEVKEKVCKSNTDSIEFICRDTSSGISNSSSLGAPTFKLVNNYKGLLFTKDIIELTRFSKEMSEDNKILQAELFFKGINTASKNVKLEYNGLIKDKAGNSTNVSSKNAIITYK